MRDRLLWWVTTAFCVLAFVGVVASAGGFRTAVGGSAPDVPVGQVIKGSRFEIAVLGAELSTTYPSGSKRDKPVVLVRLRLTNVSDRTVPYGPSTRSLEVHLPNGVVTTDWLMRGIGERAAQFDPDLTAEADANVTVTGALWSGEQTVVVVVRDEEPSSSLVATGSWSVGRPLARVSVPCKVT